MRKVLFKVTSSRILFEVMSCRIASVGQKLFKVTSSRIPIELKNSRKISVLKKNFTCTITYCRILSEVKNSEINGVMINTFSRSLLLEFSLKLRILKETECCERTFHNQFF